MSRRLGIRFNRGRYPFVQAASEGIVLPVSLPDALASGLTAFLDAEVGLTDSGDGTEVTQAVGLATFTPGSTGPVRDNLGWGRMFHSGGTPGFSRALDFNGGDWLVTSDASVLATFGASTSNFTVVALTWTQASNSNLFACGIGNGATNVSMSCLHSGTVTASMASQSAGGSGTISTASAGTFTRTRFPTATVWRQTGTQHRIYVNDFETPVLDSTFTWTSNPSTRFAIGARPDLSPDTSGRFMLKFFGMYNKSLSDDEMAEMGRYLGMRGNVPIAGWGINEITPRAWS